MFPKHFQAFARLRAGQEGGESGFGFVNCRDSARRVGVRVSLVQDNDRLGTALRHAEQIPLDLPQAHGPFQTAHDQHGVYIGREELSSRHVSRTPAGEEVSTFEGSDRDVVRRVEQQPVAYAHLTAVPSQADVDRAVLGIELGAAGRRQSDPARLTVGRG